MSDPGQRLRIFLSSPSDVQAERKMVRHIVEQLSYDPAFRDKIVLQIVAWDRDSAGTPLLATIPPQEAINQGLPLPSDCDIVIVIFWSRLGTPLPHPTYQKPDGSQYLSGTEWEYVNAITSAEETGKPFVIVYRRIEVPDIKLDDPKRSEKIEQWDRVEAFFAAFNTPRGEAQRGFNTYEKPADFSDLVERHLRELIIRLTQESAEGTLKAKPLALWRGSPFPGLRAFSPDDAPIFFGRNQETDTLTEMVFKQRFVVVVGASGSGKSSLVGAGLLPRLKDMGWILPYRHEGQWLGPRLTPAEIGDNPFMSLASKIGPMIQQPPRTLAEQLAQQPTLLTKLFPDQQLLLFIDQFEEIFTLCNPQHVPGFIALLAAAAASNTIRCVSTLRADFLARCFEFPALTRLLKGATYLLETPGPDALYAMISRPANRAGLTFEDGLIDRILRDTGTEPGSLALMAYTLDELYRRRKLSHQNYEDLGGVQGAIGKRSEGVFSRLDEEAKAALPFVFRELVAIDERGTAIRQRTPRMRIVISEAAERLLAAFTEARLLVQNKGENDTPMVEVAHEALLRNWQRLADWIDDVQQDLRLLRQVRQAAYEWNANNREAHYLWSHERLAPIYAMQAKLQKTFDDEPVVDSFIIPEADRLLVEYLQRNTRLSRKEEIIIRLTEIGEMAVPTLITLILLEDTIADKSYYGRSRNLKPNYRAAADFLSQHHAVAIPTLLEDPNTVFTRAGSIAYRCDDHELARTLLLEAARVNERDEDAWWWLHLVIDDHEEKVICLENVLTLNPDRHTAQAALDHLSEQNATPDEITVAPEATEGESVGVSVDLPSADEYDDWVRNLNLSQEPDEPLPGQSPFTFMDDADEWFGNRNFSRTNLDWFGNRNYQGRSRFGQREIGQSRKDNQEAILDYIGQKLPPERLRFFLQHTQEQLRLWAVHRLAERREAGASAVLIEALQDPLESIQLHAIQALTSKADASSIPFLTPFLFNRSNPELRQHAIKTLDRIGDPSVVPSLINALYELRNQSAIDQEASGPFVTAPPADAAARGELVAVLGRLGGVPALTALIDSYDDPDPLVREQVLKALRNFNDRAALPTALKALHDVHAPVRRQAIALLAVIGDKSVVPDVLERLNDDDMEVRLQAIEVLGIWGDESVFPALEPLLIEGVETTVRERVIQALWQIGYYKLHTPPIDPQNAQLLEALTAGDVETRTWAAKTLRVTGNQFVLPTLIQALNDPAAPVRHEAALALLNLHLVLSDRFEADAAWIPVLAQSIHDEDTVVALTSIGILGRIVDSDSAFPLLHLTTSHNPWIRAFLEDQLIGLGVTALPALTDGLLNNESIEIRIRAAKTMGRLSNSDGIPALTQALDDTHWAVRQAAVQALRNASGALLLEGIVNDTAYSYRQRTTALLGILTHTTIEDLVGTLYDRVPIIHMNTAPDLYNLSESDITTLLTKALHDPDVYTRLAATVGMKAAQIPGTVPILIQTMLDDKPEVRQTAAISVIRMYLRDDLHIDRVLVPVLIRALKAPEVLVRRTAVKLLQMSGDPAAAVPLAETLKADHALVQSDSMAALLTLGEPPLQTLIDMVDAEDERTRRMAIQLLKEMGGQEVIPALQKALRDNDWGIRRNAALALGALGTPDVIPTLRNHLVDDGENSAVICEAIARIGGPVALEALHEILGSRTEWFIRLNAIRALGILGAIQSVPLLIQTMQQDPDWRVRIFAIYALETSGNPAFVEPLRDVSRQALGLLRSAALRALAETGQDRPDTLSETNPLLKVPIDRKVGISLPGVFKGWKTFTTEQNQVRKTSADRNDGNTPPSVFRGWKTFTAEQKPDRASGNEGNGENLQRHE